MRAIFCQLFDSATSADFLAAIKKETEATPALTKYNKEKK
jgi:hypothetical protein